MKHLCFLGLADHLVTGSTAFLVDLLSTEFDVRQAVCDNAPDEEFGAADVFFFFQRPPTREQLEVIGARPVVYAPMYDEARNYGRDTIKSWTRFSIVSFCRSLHEDLLSWGFESKYYQYWPVPCLTNPCSVPFAKAFYWVRESHYVNEAVDPRMVVKLIGPTGGRIHAHGDMPTKGWGILAPFVEQRSSWFADKSELLTAMRSCSIFIAPRESEGIGMSFLDAMANGLAVIGADNPTMNEYIQNGSNGYLYNLLRPEAPDLRDLDLVRQAALDSCARGVEGWQRHKWGILEQIRSSRLEGRRVAVPRGFEYRSLKERSLRFRIRRSVKRLLGR